MSLPKMQDWERNKIIELLTEFRNKAGCRHTVMRSGNTLTKLLDHLPPEETRELHTARDHAMMDEGRGELDEVCNKLIKKYGSCNNQV
jgi:molybdopterin converting factor small subunit